MSERTFEKLTTFILKLGIFGTMLFFTVAMSINAILQIEFFKEEWFGVWIISIMVFYIIVICIKELFYDL